MVEFALVLPFLVLFIFGLVEFGRAYSARIELTAAVREGARAAALGQDGVAATKNAVTGIRSSAVNVAPIAPCPTIPTASDRAEVEASYPFIYDIPLFGRGTWTLSAKGVMRCGG